MGAISALARRPVLGTISAHGKLGTISAHGKLLHTEYKYNAKTTSIIFAISVSSLSPLD
jgi:hypothetical protein